ncbi:MAG: hypothetical protein IKA82_02520 [Clostridia bacterium]|nr:hypothetical protein [Clostridia bacterium]
MKSNERIQWFHRKTVEQAYPNAHRLSEQFNMSLSQAKRDIRYMREVLSAPLEYSKEGRGYYYTHDYSLPVFQTSSNDEDYSGVMAPLEGDISDSSINPLIQMQLPYGATIEVSDKLAVLELKPFIVEKLGRNSYQCEFHSTELFLAAILSIDASIRITSPEWLRQRLISSARRILESNEELD